MFSHLIARVHLWLLGKLLSPEAMAIRRGVRLGANCTLNRGINFGSEPYLVSIGDNFYSSTNIQFVTHDGAVNVLRNLYPNYKNVDLFAPISIGNNVFIGYGVTVLPGSIIGSNVVVGAGSLVKGTLSDNGVYAGVPAKFVCSIQDYLERHTHKFLYSKGLAAKEKELVIRRQFDVR